MGTASAALMTNRFDAGVKCFDHVVKCLRAGTRQVCLDTCSAVIAFCNMSIDEVGKFDLLVKSSIDEVDKFDV